MTGHIEVSRRYPEITHQHRYSRLDDQGVHLPYISFRGQTGPASSL